MHGRLSVHPQSPLHRDAADIVICFFLPLSSFTLPLFPPQYLAKRPTGTRRSRSNEILIVLATEEEEKIVSQVLPLSPLTQLSKKEEKKEGKS